MVCEYIKSLTKVVEGQRIAHETNDTFSKKIIIQYPVFVRVFTLFLKTNWIIEIFVIKLLVTVSNWSHKMVNSWRLTKKTKTNMYVVFICLSGPNEFLHLLHELAPTGDYKVSCVH